MEEQTFELEEETQTNIVKLYTPNQVSGATVFGGPIVAGIMFYENFKAIGELKKAQLSLLMSIITTVIIFGLLIILPEDIVEQIPRIVIPITYSLGAKYIAEKYFKHLLESEEYTKRSFGAAVLRSILGLIPIALLVGGIILYENSNSITIPLEDRYEQMSFAGGNRVYYDYGIDEKVIDTIGQTMVDMQYFDRTEHNADLIVNQSDSALVVSFFNSQEYMNDSELIDYIKYTGTAINTMITPRVVVQLCVYEDTPGHTFKLTEADTLVPVDPNSIEIID